MRLASLLRTRRHLLTALAVAATAVAGPAPAIAAGASGPAEAPAVAPVVVTVGSQSPARWIPGRRRPVLTSPSLRSAVTAVVPTGTTAANLAPDHSGSFTFMAEQAPGDPIRWDACGTVHWVFNPASAPAGGLQAVQSAVSRIASATGLRFAYDGTTAAAPTGAYLDAQSATTGFRPLLVGWSTGSASTLLAGQPAGLVGMNQTIWARPASGAAHITSSVVALNAAVTARTSGANSWYTFALHELGHAVGLGHTADPTQIMAPTIPAGAADFGSGDLAGLAKVGGTC